MTADPVIEVGDRLRSELRRRRLIFLHLGHFFDDVREELLSYIATTSLTAAEFLNSNALPPGAVAITECETLARSLSPFRLGQLRDRVMSALDAGSDVFLVSRGPRLAYPVVPGSSLLEDVYVPEVGLGILSCNAGRGFDGIPLYSDLPDDTSRIDLLWTILKELGPDCCAALDTLLFELASTDGFETDALSVQEIEAILGSGLACLIDGRLCLPTDMREITHLRTALDGVLSTLVAPQHALPGVLASLWEQERLLKRALRERAISSFGAGWRNACAQGETADRLLKRAQAEAYPRATKLADLRNPFEWFTVGEMLDLVENASWVDRLDLPQTFWQRYRAELTPVRNRVAHARLLRRGDTDVATRWLSLMRSHVK